MPFYSTLCFSAGKAEAIRHEKINKNKSTYQVDVLPLEIGILVMQGCSGEMEFVAARVEKTWSSWK